MVHVSIALFIGNTRDKKIFFYILQQYSTKLQSYTFACGNMLLVVLKIFDGLMISKMLCTC